MIATMPTVNKQEIRLRPYQRQTIDAIRRDWKAGYKNVLAVGATGMGKTVVFLALIHEILQEQPAARFMIVAHRKELIDQPAERLAQFWPERSHMVGIVMGNTDEPDAQIIIGTIQTLQIDRRLDAVLAHGAIDYLIIDETHHSSADGYLKVINRLREVNPHLLHLGVTATPVRADGDGLPYDVKSAHFGVRELVKDKYLAPPRWLAINTKIDIGQIAINYGNGGADFNQSQLKSVFETDRCYELVVETHQRYAAGRKAIAFTVSVEGAVKLAEEFNKAGIPAASASGTTSKDDRKEILAAFRRGELEVLTNCALFTEGVDLPDISCIHQVRPTKSDGLYLQMVGRGLRLHPGKEDCLILDYAPADARNVVMLGDVLGVKVKKVAYIKESEDAEEGDALAGFTFDGEDFGWMGNSPMEIVSRQLDYLNLSPYTWQGEKGDWLYLGLGPGERDEIDRTLAISPPGDTMTLWGVFKRNEERWHSAMKLAEGTFEELSEIADGYIEKHGNQTLAMKQRGWRSQPPSDGQIKFATKLGIKIMGMTKGQVANAITQKLAFNALKRAGAISR